MRHGRHFATFAESAAVGLFCALLPLGEVKATASVSSLGILIVFIGVQFALIRLRRAQPETKRPFRVPLPIGRLPLLPVLGIGTCGVCTPGRSSRASSPQACWCSDGSRGASRCC
jgi:amino acid transporter